MARRTLARACPPLMRRAFRVASGRAWAVLLASSWMLAPLAAMAADKTDIVWLDNGDRLTGEIKGLERGLLTLKTVALDTITIEWPHVVRIQTKQLLEVEQVDGSRSYGHATDPTDKGEVLLGTESDKAKQAPIALDSVVRINPISEGRWLDRLSGHASVGYSAASANEDRQLTISADMTYRAPRRNWTLNYEAARTESANNPVSERQSLDGVYRWFRSERWFWGATGGFTTNDELDLNLRTLIGGGIGRYWIQDTNLAFSTLGGIAVSNENFEGEPAQRNVEGVLQGQYEFFHFDDPDIDVSANLALFPSFTTSGRLRSELSVKLRYELIKDLYYELSYIRSQDNKPPSDDAEGLDWSVVSSLGYKF